MRTTSSSSSTTSPTRAPASRQGGDESAGGPSGTVGAVQRRIARAIGLALFATAITLTAGAHVDASTPDDTFAPIDRSVDDEPPGAPGSTDEDDVGADEPDPDPDAPVGPDDDPESDPESDEDDDEPRVPGSIAPQVRASSVDTGSVALAAMVLIAVGTFSWILARRGRREPSGQPPRATRHRGSVGPTRPVETADPGMQWRPPSASDRSAALRLIIELGEALIDAGDAVNTVEHTMRSLAGVYGIEELNVMVVPTALIVSAPGVDEATTEVKSAGWRSLRLDQIDDIVRLVNATERGEFSVAQGRAELERIRTSTSPIPTSLALFGYVFTSAGIALLLRGGWREVLLAAALGLVVGFLRRRSQRLSESTQPFWPLVSAMLVSITVFSLARVVDELILFPALAAPLVTFLPGALLTTGVLELATGQIVAGAARVASGAMRLLLLALGIVAGAQLVGVPGDGTGTSPAGPVGAILPWIGVAAFGVGAVWFHGARRSSLIWILMALYTAYAGQVIGGLFFGSALSAFFGAILMTLTALLIARQRSGPTPLVTFLPGFWILVPGALGLEGVTRLISDGELAAGTNALTTTAVSMVGISLGILLGMTIASRDPDRPWVDAAVHRTHPSR